MKKKLLTILGIVCASALITVIMTWPFIQHLPTYFNDQSEYSLQVFIMLHSYESLIKGAVSSMNEYFTTRQFYSFPLSLAFSDHMFIPSLIFSLIYHVSQNIVLSANLYSLCVLSLSIIISFFVINYFVHNTPASFIGSIIFTFNPIASVSIPDISQLLNKMFLPLVFFYWYLFLRKPSLVYSIAFIVSFTLNALSSVYFEIMTIVLLPISAIPILVQQYKIYGVRTFIRYKYLILGVLVFPILFYFNYPYLKFSQQYQVIRTVEENVHYSARLIDWFSPNPNSMMYGALVQRFMALRNPREPDNSFNYSEHTLFPNIIPTFLCIVGLIYLVRRYRKQPIHRFIILFYGFLMIAGFCFTFGPYYMGWNGIDSTIKLPYYYFYSLIKPLQGIRVPTRFEHIFYVPFSLFSAFGVSVLCKRKLFVSICVFVILLLGIMLENKVDKSYNDTSVFLTRYTKKELSFLKDQPTVHYPITIPNVWGDLRYLNWVSLSEEKMLNGNSGYFPARWIDLMLEVKDWNGKNTINTLKSIGIRYAIFHTNLMDSTNQINSQKEFQDTGVVYKTDDVMIVDLTLLN